MVRSIGGGTDPAPPVLAGRAREDGALGVHQARQGASEEDSRSGRRQRESSGGRYLSDRASIVSCTAERLAVCPMI